MILTFDTCRLDIDRRLLWRDGATVHVEPQVFDLLAHMAQSNGAVVSKNDLVDAVWNGMAISDATISARINAARVAVGDSGKKQVVLRTIPRRGFAFVPDVHVDTAANATAPSPAVTFVSPEMPPISYTHSADGTALAWSSMGDGYPLMRIGHWLSHLELDITSNIWGPTIAALAQRTRLIRYDLRGTGLSSRDAPLTGIDVFADDMRAVADAADADRLDLLAASQAAPVALHFAAQNPDRVRRIILIGGYAEGRVHRESREPLEESTLLAMIHAGWGKADSPFMQAFCTLFAPDATRTQRDEMVQLQQASASAETAMNLRKLVDRFNVLDDLPLIDAPTLIFHAEDDAIHPMSQGLKLAAHLRNAQFQRLPGGNHMVLPHLPAWTQMMSRIETFLSS